MQQISGHYFCNFSTYSKSYLVRSFKNEFDSIQLIERFKLNIFTLKGPNEIAARQYRANLIMLNVSSPEKTTEAKVNENNVYDSLLTKAICLGCFERSS